MSKRITHSCTNADNGYWIDVWIAYHSTAIYLFLFLKFGYNSDLTRDEIEDYAHSFLKINSGYSDLDGVLFDFWNEYEDDICLLPSERFKTGFVFMECQMLVRKPWFKTNIPSDILSSLQLKLPLY
jgi:hypothetical protein